MIRRVAKLYSAAGYALRVHVKRVDGLARGHEQAVVLAPAEADVGTALGQGYVADGRGVGCKDAHTIEIGPAHAPAAPEIAVGIAAHAIWRAGSCVQEDAAVAESGAVLREVVDLELAVGHSARLHDVELALVGREAEPVGPEDIIGDDLAAAG